MFPPPPAAMKRSLSQFADDALPRPHAHQEMGSFTMAVGISEARTAMARELLVDLRRPELGAFLADAAPETTGADPEAMRSALSRHNSLCDFALTETACDVNS